MADILKDAIASAVAAISSVVPSQSPIYAVRGVRLDSKGETRKIVGTVVATILSTEDAAPFADASATAQTDSQTVLVMREGDGCWFEHTPPQQGDVFTALDGVRRSVDSVSDVRGLYWKVTLRRS